MSHFEYSLLETKNIQIPDNIKIVHDDEYNVADFVGDVDEPYFKLYHNLKVVECVNRDDIDIVVGTTDMLDVFADIINKS